jgi:hypothetical protein
MPTLPAEWPARVEAALASVTVSPPAPTLPFAPTTTRTLASEAPAGVVIEGFAHPGAALAARHSTSLGADAFRTPISIVEPDPIAFLIAAARCDDTSLFADPRCHWFLGPDAPTHLRAFLAARLDTALPRTLVRTNAGAPATIESILTTAHDAQQREHASLRARLDARPARDASHWANRFAQARDGHGPPLRILILTTRYSTYVRHAAIDLAAAVTAMGHNPRTLEEPTTDTRLASVAYLRAALDFQPDCIVAINYTRPQLRTALPLDVPMVCWVQDRMPHLFDRALGAAQGPLDFLAGHIHPSLYLDFGYPREQALFRAVPASPRTFHTGPADPARARTLACDVMYAGHQSEHPDALRDRLIPTFASVPGLADAARDIDARLRALAASGTLTASALDTLTRDALGARNIPLANARAVEAFDASFTRTLAERIHRHQMLEWAGEICTRRGWSMHLCGNGWNTHPTLHRFARPALDHADDLRTAYRSARASLHASLATNAHQRIAECALSSGLMLRRGPSPDWQLIRKLAIRAALQAWGPGEPHTIGTKHGVRLVRDLPPDAGTPDWSRPRAHRLHAAQGLPRPAPNPDGTFTTELFAKSPVIERDLPRIPDIPLWTFPDYALPFADETSFSSPSELEQTLERAITDDAWRASTIAAHAAIARDYWTTDRFAADTIAFLAHRLGASTKPASEEAA